MKLGKTSETLAKKLSDGSPEANFECIACRKTRPSLSDSEILEAKAAAFRCLKLFSLERLISKASTVSANLQL
jgi:hypothetical protein